jgi:hypothetical protein
MREIRTTRIITESIPIIVTVSPMNIIHMSGIKTSTSYSEMNSLAHNYPEFDFVITGLFCHHDDKKTVEAGKVFQKKIGNGSSDFILLTYADYFECMQKLNLNWEQRELVMMLWARYCGLELSKNVADK